MLRDEFERRDGRREAMEGREALAKRAEIEAADASATRKRLELGSSGGPKRDFPGLINKMAADSAVRERPGLEAIDAIRKGQRLGRRTAAQHNRTHDRLERAGFLRGLID